jgi:SAM-dependent methyltransferase
MGDTVRTVPLTKETVTAVAKGYCARMHQLENAPKRRRNERSIEFSFVFRHLTSRYPKTVLDVGTGMSSLPHMMALCGFDTEAIDYRGDSWPDSVFNRHFMVREMDVKSPTFKTKFDFITCVSVLEHIQEHRKAMACMLDMLTPLGVIVVTAPFTAKEYTPNAYDLEGSGYGQKAQFETQIFSNTELRSWGGAVLDRENWKMFSGELWTVGAPNDPPITTDKNDYDLSCLLIGRT